MNRKRTSVYYDEEFQQLGIRCVEKGSCGMFLVRHEIGKNEIGNNELTLKNRTEVEKF